jgi:hypothetical protein
MARLGPALGHGPPNGFGLIRGQRLPDAWRQAAEHLFGAGLTHDGHRYRTPWAQNGHP